MIQQFGSGFSFSLVPQVDEVIHRTHPAPLSHVWRKLGGQIGLADQARFEVLCEKLAGQVRCDAVVGLQFPGKSPGFDNHAIGIKDQNLAGIVHTRNPLPGRDYL